MVDYFWLLALGNLVKQIFYNSRTVKEVNDYWWGGLVTLWLIINLIRLWVTQKQKARI